MALHRYRVIVKVLCEHCQNNVSMHKAIDTNCKNCKYLKYNNVNRLIKFKDFLNDKFTNWVWFNVYEYIKGENGRELARFQKGKKEPVAESI